MGALEVRKNVLDAELLNELHLFTRQGMAPTRINFFNWSQSVVQSSNAIFFFELEDELKQKIISTLLEKGIIKKQPKRYAANVALYSRQSFIPWHDDGSHLTSITIYLNQEWSKDWGGYFAYEEGEEVKAIVPTYNTCVAFEPPLMHSVTLTNLNAPFRESLQIFIDEFEDAN